MTGRQGTRGRLYGLLWKSFGPIDIQIDGQFAAAVDCRTLPEQFADRIGDSPLPGQLLFDSGYLEEGRHELSVIIKESDEADSGVGAGIEAFDFLAEEQLGFCEA